MLSTQRELSVYAGRPTALFSEPSNYAKFLSIIVAAYMIVDKCSKRSLAALVILYLLVRSVSYFYAAPLMALAMWRSTSAGDVAKSVRARLGGTKLFILLGIGGLLLAGVLITQSIRVGNALLGQDNSLNGRILLPMQYMLSNTDRLVAGFGLTPQDDLTQYTIMTYAQSVGNLSPLTPVMAATSTTITFLVGIGMVGLAVFYIAMFLMRKVEGVWVASVFLVANIINAGYNSSTTFVLSALMLSLAAYHSGLTREDRRRSLSDALSPEVISGGVT
jgi:hypothetical protein